MYVEYFSLHKRLIRGKNMYFLDQIVHVNKNLLGKNLRRSSQYLVVTTGLIGHILAMTGWSGHTIVITG